MEFGLSEDQKLLQETVRRFVAEQVPLDAIRNIAGGDETSRNKLSSGITELGLHGIAVPEDLGGAGLGLLDAVLVQECLGYGVVPSGFFSNTVAAWALTDLAPELSGQIASGQAAYGLALNELVSRRDNAGVKEKDGALTGICLMAMNAETASHILVGDEDGCLHVSTPQQWDALPTIDRTRIFSEIRFSDSEVIERAGAGERVLAAACLLLAADSLGAAQAMLDKAVAYAAERKQFGRVIGSFQAVKHMCAEMAARIEPARALIWHAAHALDTRDEEALMMAFLAKAHMSEVGTFVARTATEVHGGMGFTDLVGLHYWFKRIGVNRQLLGSPSQLRERAAMAQGLVAV